MAWARHTNTQTHTVMLRDNPSHSADQCITIGPWCYAVSPGIPAAPSQGGGLLPWPRGGVDTCPGPARRGPSCSRNMRDDCGRSKTRVCVLAPHACTECSNNKQLFCGFLDSVSSSRWMETHPRGSVDEKHRRLGDCQSFLCTVCSFYSAAGVTAHDNTTPTQTTSYFVWDTSILVPFRSMILSLRSLWNISRGFIFASVENLSKRKQVEGQITWQ